MKHAVLIALALGACSNEVAIEARDLTRGDPERGRQAIRFRGCGSCHDIPGLGIRGHATVGPPLGGLRDRRYLAGNVPNTPNGVLRWILDPQGVVPGNVMPNMGIEDSEARDIAAYLYTLE